MQDQGTVAAPLNEPATPLQRVLRDQDEQIDKLSHVFSILAKRLENVTVSLPEPDTQTAKEAIGGSKFVSLMQLNNSRIMALQGEVARLLERLEV